MTVQSSSQDGRFQKKTNNKQTFQRRIPYSKDSKVIGQARPGLAGHRQVLLLHKAGMQLY